MSGRLLRIADTIGHFLYTPTMRGQRAMQYRWHHRIHLVPYVAIRGICDRYDARLLGEEKDS